MKRNKFFFWLSITPILLIVITKCEKNESISYGKVTDQDGNTYKTVVIGIQTWMAENLKTTKFNDGLEIPEYYFFTDPSTCKNIYGALYPVTILNTKKLCPLGWHIPDESDWAVLFDYLGDVDVAGGKLKEAGTIHWYTPNTGATNESGFSALPGGSFDRVVVWVGNNNTKFDTLFLTQSTLGYWWSVSKADPLLDPGYIRLQFDNTKITKGTVTTYRSLSVRCIKN